MDVEAFKGIVHNRAQLSADIKEATEERKFLDFQITEHMEEQPLADKKKTVTDDGYTVAIVTRKGSTKLDPALLLKSGVSPTVIAEATVVGDPSTSVRVTAPKEAK